MPIFGNSKFLPVILYQKGLNKFGMHIFGHSKFIPVVLGKIFRKNSELPFLAIPNLYQSSWEKLSEKIWKGHLWPYQICTSLPGKNCQKKIGTAIVGHSAFIPVFLGKVVRKNFERPFLAIPNLYQSSWEKLSQPLLAILNLYQSFLKKLFLGKIVRKIQNSQKWPFQIFSDNFFCTYHFNRV